MEVTYKEIVGGYILKEGDTLVIHGIEYTVILSTFFPYYFLREKNYQRNDLVFTRLGIKDKEDYCKVIVGKESVFNAIFPEIDNLENLTKVVRALYEQSPYKVGDKVKLVSDLKGLPWVIEGMRQYAGQTFTIEDIELKDHSGTLNGDPHGYRLSGGYIWPPQAIECRITSETKEPKEEIFEESRPTTVVCRSALEGGYILEEYDIIYIGNIKYKVHPNHFLVTGGSFDKIFKVLGLTQKEKDDWAAKFGCRHTGQVFPEFDTFKDLTKFVLDIYKKYDEFEKAQSSPAVTCISSSEKAVCGGCGTDPVPSYEIRKDVIPVRPDCHFDDEPIIINNPKSKTKTTIKL